MDSLPRLVSAALTSLPENSRIYVGYSGGVDSHVLLHLLSTHKDSYQITAVYIHHGLQADADHWQNHCEQTAKSLGLDFLGLQVNAHPKPGESPEEAARNARYQAFKGLLNDGDNLFIGQHREDQLETVLLQLLRGSGLRGLSGMPVQTEFGPGKLIRPLLTTAKQDLLTYAQTHQLHWVSDPSNDRDDYDRNYLRNHIIPLLKQRWPACDKTISRTARHCAEAQTLLGEVAENLLTSAVNTENNALSINALLQHDKPRQRLLIRQWFELMNQRMPSQAFIDRIFSDVIAARPQRDPALSGPGYAIRRYREHLFLINTQRSLPTDQIWPEHISALPLDNGRRLQLTTANTGISKQAWQQAKVDVRFNVNSEKIRLPHRDGHHALKKLYQEQGIPPWERLYIPLIYLDNKLAAVGDLWLSADFYQIQPGNCVQFQLLSNERGSFINTMTK